jgi:hypothetical protein
VWFNKSISLLNGTFLLINTAKEMTFTVPGRGLIWRKEKYLVDFKKIKKTKKRFQKKPLVLIQVL